MRPNGTLYKYLLKSILHPLCSLLFSLAVCLNPVTASAQTGTFSATSSMSTARVWERHPRSRGLHEAIARHVGVR